MGPQQPQLLRQTCRPAAAVLRWFLIGRARPGRELVATRKRLLDNIMAVLMATAVHKLWAGGGRPEPSCLGVGSSGRCLGSPAGAASVLRRRRPGRGSPGPISFRKVSPCGSNTTKKPSPGRCPSNAWIDIRKIGVPTRFNIFWDFGTPCRGRFCSSDPNLHKAAAAVGNSLRDAGTSGLRCCQLPPCQIALPSTVPTTTTPDCSMPSWLQT